MYTVHIYMNDQWSWENIHDCNYEVCKAYSVPWNPLHIRENSLTFSFNSRLFPCPLKEGVRCFHANYIHVHNSVVKQGKIYIYGGLHAHWLHCCRCAITPCLIHMYTEYRVRIIKPNVCSFQIGRCWLNMAGGGLDQKIKHLHSFWSWVYATSIQFHAQAYSYYTKGLAKTGTT